jgi:hypothetical protein
VGLRPLVCSAKIWYYTTVSNHQYTPLTGKRQTRARGRPRLYIPVDQLNFGHIRGLSETPDFRQLFFC